MDKFAKKITKIIEHPENALVVGNGFDCLSSILMAHNSVFVVDSNNINTKSKKLIYRETFDNLEMLGPVAVVYFDLSKLHLLEKLKNFWFKNRAYVVIEGGDPIGREFSKPLYDTGWNCTAVEKHFHVWKKIK
jgi:hypothetical protein